MKKLILLSIAVVSIFFARAQNNIATTHVRELLEVTGSANLGKQLMSSMTASYKKLMPAVPEEFWEEISKEANTHELIEFLVPLYTKHYTDEEITQLIAFYKTPLGKKLIEKMPIIMQESYVIGSEWGKKLGEKVASKLIEKGYTQTN